MLGIPIREYQVYQAIGSGFNDFVNLDPGVRKKKKIDKKVYLLEINFSMI
jgi:hypothetical protein